MFTPPERALIARDDVRIAAVGGVVASNRPEKVMLPQVRTTLPLNNVLSGVISSEICLTVACIETLLVAPGGSAAPASTNSLPPGASASPCATLPGINICAHR
jgi:hypothetical protein